MTVLIRLRLCVVRKFKMMLLGHIPMASGFRNYLIFHAMAPLHCVVPIDLLK